MKKANKMFPKKIKVQVDKDHIKRGRPYSNVACPIAFALWDKYQIKDKFRFKYGISVGSNCLTSTENTLRMTKGKFRAYYSLPKRAQDFIRTFDSHKSSKVKPITFYAKLTKILTGELKAGER